MKFVLRWSEYYVARPAQTIEGCRFETELTHAWRFDKVEDATAAAMRLMHDVVVLPVEDSVDVYRWELEDLRATVARLMERVEDLESR